MNNEKIKTMVHEYYWKLDYNCATTTLLLLSEAFNLELSPQVIDSAVGMHGAGKYGAQCGLVEGSLLFIGIYGRYIKLDDEKIVGFCSAFAEDFEKKFSSLLCSRLRPGGFNEDDPAHLCEAITVRAVSWGIPFLRKKFNSLI